jgi:hypothetical protein
MHYAYIIIYLFIYISISFYIQIKQNESLVFITLKVTDFQNWVEDIKNYHYMN